MQKGFDYIGNAVVYFCHDGKGKFLMMKRGTRARDERGVWDIGGAAIEFGETAEQTLKREIKEEYNANVIDFEFLGFRDVHRNIDDKQTHWICLDFKVLVDSKNVKIGEPEKFDDIGWFTLKDFPKPNHSRFPEFLKKYEDKIK